MRNGAIWHDTKLNFLKQQNTTDLLHLQNRLILTTTTSSLWIEVIHVTHMFHIYIRGKIQLHSQQKQNIPTMVVTCERTKGNNTRRMRKQSLLAFGKWIIDGNNLLLQLWLVGSHKFVKLLSIFKKEESRCGFDVPWSAELLQHMQSVNIFTFLTNGTCLQTLHSKLKV